MRLSNRSVPEEFLDMAKYPWRGTDSSLSLRSFSLRELWESQKEGSAVERKGWKRTGRADAIVVRSFEAYTLKKRKSLAPAKKKPPIS